MEAKVDVRKLQMLNDRIIQTLEALTQVRASVHGIGQNGPYSAYGQPMASPVYPGGLGHTPLLSPYAQWPVPLNGSFAPIGLSHSSYPQSPFVPQLTPWQSPAAIPQYAYAQQQPYAQQPYAPWTPFAPMGLSHSGIDDVERRIVEQRANDVTRLMQTFPYGAYV